jgi:Fur family iron response transcriptional regulator
MDKVKTDPSEAVLALLREAGVRPTRPRVLLAELLFDGQDKHVTAEQLHAATARRGDSIALATVYNNLHQFTAAGLLREVVVDATSVYFDTNVSEHHHFFDMRDGHLTDVPHQAGLLKHLPSAPEGREIDQIDVIIRLR